MKPPGWETHFEKYLKKDGALLGDFLAQTKDDTIMNINFKLINFDGDIILKARFIILEES